MASNVASLATEGLPPGQQNSVSATTAPSDDIVRLTKRQRESESVSPRSRAAQLSKPPGSPSKVARLSLATTTRPAVPLTGAAALEDERRRGVEEQAHSPSIGPNPARSVLESLMSGVAQAMSRPSDTIQLAPTANMEPATKAATELSMAAGNAAHMDDHDRDEGSPPANANANSNNGSSAPVAESPAPMDLDSKKNDQVQGHQLMSPDERPQSGSMSYPGSLQTAANLSEPLNRGMSFTMPSQIQSSPTSSSGKKHKCPYCSTEFTRHHNLKSHLLTHSQEKPYVCTECQMRFRRLHDLKRHGKLHTGEKPHICPKCDRKFARGDALARHSKGAGGCAGRRASMGSFADGDELDGTIGEGDDSTMSGVAYDSVEDEELRRQSLPSMGVQHSSGDNYGAHSRTYPPAGPRPAASGLYPPNVNLSQAGTISSTSVPDSMASSHTANTSVSSIPGGPGGSGMYSQAGMTESPKPLSPGLPSHDSANLARQRSPTMTQQYQQQQVGRPPSDLQSPHSSGQARPKLPGLSHPGFVAPNSGTYSHGRTPSGAQPSGDSGNMFAQSDPSVWEYIRLLEDKIKSLSDKVVSLDQEVASLRKQLDTREGASTT
ncbi:zinc finger protein crol gamma, partial [Metarhizium majus ARSEF 297]